MIVTIEVPAELAERLDSAGIAAEEAGKYALAALSEAAENAEVRVWWSRLTELERETERASTRSSLAAADTGRSSPAAEVAARIRAKYQDGQLK